MNIIIFGGAGFIGTNLTLRLSECKQNQITVVDRRIDFFCFKEKENVKCVVDSCDNSSNFDELVKEQDVVYHLISTTIPSTSNSHIATEIESNVIVTVKLLDACVKNNIRRIVFLSSGGTVYGNVNECPISEEVNTFPINSYGLQKVTIEKLLYLYWSMYRLDYRVIRLSNPYGPYQRPNGKLGVVTNFVYKALTGQEVNVFGDGTVVRDFLYIDDAITAIEKLSCEESQYKLYNIGSGKGNSINEVLHIIENVLEKKVNVRYYEGRNVDVKRNVLDVSRYCREFGDVCQVSIEEGILKTAEFMTRNRELYEFYLR